METETYNSGGGSSDSGKCCSVFKLKLIVLLVIFLFRLVVVIWLAAIDSFNLRFFTYINYLLFTVAMAYLLVSIFHRPLFRIFVLYVFPIIFGTSLFISITIVLMIMINDEIFLATTVFRGGARSIAMVHSGDWLLHQLPAIEAIVVAACITEYARAIVKNAKNRWYGSVRYWIYMVFFFTAPLWPLVAYISIFPFEQNYPVGLTLWLSILLMLGMSILIGSILYIVWMTPRRVPISEWEEDLYLAQQYRGSATNGGNDNQRTRNF